MRVGGKGKRVNGEEMTEGKCCDIINHDKIYSG